MHGTYSIGKLCSLIYSKRIQTPLQFNLPIQIKTSFLKPILLPSAITCRAFHNSRGIMEYQMCDKMDNNKIYIEGSISPAPLAA